MATIILCLLFDPFNHKCKNHRNEVPLCRKMNNGSGDFHRPDVLLPNEIESYVDALEISKFEELGSNG